MTVVTLTDYQPTERFDDEAWTKAQIQGSAARGGPWVDVGDEITLEPVDADPKEPITRNFTTTEALSTQTWFRVVFKDEDENELLTDPITTLRQTFAVVSDVEVRAGRDLNDAEQATASHVLVAVTGLIADEVGRDIDWVTNLELVPETFRRLCIEKALGAVSNPENVAVDTETLGAHTVSQIYRRSGLTTGLGDVFLSDDERQLVRDAMRNLQEVSVGEQVSILDTIDDNRLILQPPWVTGYINDSNGN